MIRRSSQTEVQSGIDGCRRASSKACREIAVAADGRRLVSKEPVVLINLPKRATGKPANVVIRGVTPAGSRCGRRCSSSRDGCFGRERPR